MPDLRCKDHLSPAASYRLRLSHALVNNLANGGSPVAVQTQDRGARIKVCTGGYRSKCQVFSATQAANKSTCQRQPRLPITIADIADGLVVLYLDAAGHVVDSAMMKYEAITAEAVCRGLRFRVHHSGPGKLAEVDFFLDDP